MTMFKNKKNLNFIKKQFENNTPNIPDSLNEENIKSLLNKSNSFAVTDKPLVEKRHIKVKTKAIISIAACVAVTITALTVNFSMNNSHIKVKSDDIITTKSYNSKNTEKSENHPFKNYNELVECFDKMQSNLQVSTDLEANYNTAYLSEETAKSSNPSTDGCSISYCDGSSGSSYESTYKQVEGVDEGDIIKNDGKYIYIANSDYGHTYDEYGTYIQDNHIAYVDIYETDKEKTKLVGNIKDFQPKGSYADIYDMYLYDNKIVIIYSYSNDEGCQKTATAVYDISDKTAPKKIKTFNQDGDYIASRIVGNHLYLISNKYVNLWYDIGKDFSEDCIPKYSCGSETDKKICIEDVYCVKKPNEPNYVVASSINLDENDKYTDTKAILGAGENIYCNQNNLYVLCNNYEKDIEQTEIIKFSIDNGLITFKTSNKVVGIIDNQYSVDEKDGNFRIATTCYDVNGDEYNTLSVLDENLKQIGKVQDFAKGETIKAVRFIGDMAYVITYEETDPLFVIDLSNPKKPEIKGSVKISGFSSMLHPVDENTLLGIGYSTESFEWGESENGIKIALFDISDSTKPKVLDSKVMKNYYSQAQENPKALVVNNDMGYFAMPIHSEKFDSSDTFLDSNDSGAQIFKIENNKIKLTQYIKINDPYLFTAERCTYIDDYLYIIRSNDNGNYGIEGHKVNK